MWGREKKTEKRKMDEDDDDVTSCVLFVGEAEASEAISTSGGIARFSTRATTPPMRVAVRNTMSVSGLRRVSARRFRANGTAQTMPVLIHSPESSDASVGREQKRGLES